MKVLGKGTANGAISILHSLGLGKGCSIGIDLSTEVTLLTKRRQYLTIVMVYWMQLKNAGDRKGFHSLRNLVGS